MSKSFEMSSGLVCLIEFPKEVDIGGLNRVPNYLWILLPFAQIEVIL